MIVASYKAIRLDNHCWWHLEMGLGPTAALSNRLFGYALVIAELSTLTNYMYDTHILIKTHAHTCSELQILNLTRLQLDHCLLATRTLITDST